MTANVKTTRTQDGYKYRLVRSGRVPLPDPKLVRTVRISDSEMDAIENGLLRLSVVNRHIVVLP